jgi:DNA-binding NtrC family response regulator
MTEACRVLVVAATPALASQLEWCVRAAGHRPTVVTTFAAAKGSLERHPRPDLVISEIKLCEYNGLHVAVRGHAVGVPAIVVGEKTFKREAEALAATWLSPDSLDGEALPAAIARLVVLPHAAHGTFPWYPGVVPPDVHAVDAGVEVDPSDLSPTPPAAILH